MRTVVRSAAICVIASSVAYGQGVDAGSVCNRDLIRSTYSFSNRLAEDWRLADYVSEEDYNKIKQETGATARIYGVPVTGKYEDFRERIRKLKTLHKELIEDAVSKSCMDRN